MRKIKPTFGNCRKIVAEIKQNLFFLHFRIEDSQACAFFDELLADMYSGTFAGVRRVLLERKSKDRNLLSRDGVEHTLRNPSCEPGSLKIVYFDHLRGIVV